MLSEYSNEQGLAPYAFVLAQYLSCICLRGSLHETPFGHHDVGKARSRVGSADAASH